MTKAESTQLLSKYNIPFGSWGSGNSKTLDHLLKEINIGEAKLIETENGLLRTVNVIVMDVYFNDGESKLKLFEDRQVYKNGRIAKRQPPNSLLEKIKPDEEPFIGARRTLAEELGITSDLEIKDLGSRV